MGRGAQGSDYSTLSQALGIGERLRIPLCSDRLWEPQSFPVRERWVSAHPPLAALPEPQEEVGEMLWRSTSTLRPHGGEDFGSGEIRVVAPRHPQHLHLGLGSLNSVCQTQDGTGLLRRPGDKSRDCGGCVLGKSAGLEATLTKITRSECGR